MALGDKRAAVMESQIGQNGGVAPYKHADQHRKDGLDPITPESIGAATEEYVDDAIAGLSEDTGGSGINLLDNWYFADPINQRAKTQYVGAGYAIDRWSLVASGITMDTSDGVSLIWESTGLIRQELQSVKQLDGRKVTLSGLFKDVNVGSENNITLRLRINNSFAGLGVKISDDGLFSVTVTAPDAVESFYVEIGAASGSCKVIALKLEFGERQTLARQDESGNWVLNDPSPNKTIELLKCQRYQQVLTGSSYHTAFGTGDNIARIQIPLTTELQKTPTSADLLQTYNWIGNWVNHTHSVSVSVQATEVKSITNDDRTSIEIVFAVAPASGDIYKGDVFVMQYVGASTILDAN